MEWKDQVERFERQNAESNAKAERDSQALIERMMARQAEDRDRREHAEHHGIGGYLIAGLLGFVTESQAMGSLPDLLGGSTAWPKGFPLC
jgi:hypothetical protein